jgi:peptidyl-prolyl cis-trans isomerase SurA
MMLASRILSVFAAMRVRMLAALVIVVSGAAAALAQNVVVFVNGDPITAIDIEQRAKFLLLTTQKQPPRKDVLNQLIDEKLKVREGRRWNVEATDKEVDSNFASMARRLGQSADQLAAGLAQKGVNVSTLKARIRADMVWEQLVRGRYQSRLQVSDKEILAQLDTPEERNAVGYDYTLRPILFLIPPGAPAATYESRRREADALRKTFKGCDQSIPAVRAMRDVAVRTQVTRSSADLPAGLRKILDSIPVGELTAPEVTRHGIELFAICAKTETKTNTPERNKVRQTMLEELFKKESDRYLRQLRRAALIEHAGK